MPNGARRRLAPTTSVTAVGARQCLAPTNGQRKRTRSAVTSGGDLRLLLGRLAQDVAAAPHGLDIVLAARCVGQLLAQFADEDVDDLELGLVHATVEMVEKHLLGQGRALAQAQEL